MLKIVSDQVRDIGAATMQALNLVQPHLFKMIGSRKKAADVLALLAGALREDDAAFDAKPWKLNCPNGVVDLRTGQVREHRAADRFLMVTGVEYRPAAKSARWAKALEAVEPDLAAWLRLRLGQAVTGTRPRDDRVLFLRGGGSNGKSVLVDAVSNALGAYAAAVPPRVLLGSPGDHSTEMTTFQGVRLALLEEMPEHHLSGAMLKRVAGPKEITARRISRDNITFPVQFSLFVTTNYPLRIADTDHGTWRRVTMVPFPFKYDRVPDEGERKRDPALKRWSENVADAAVLAWLVAAAVDCYRSMPDFDRLPDSVEQATNEVRSENDLLGQFAEERLTLAPGVTTPKSEVYAAYQTWANAAGQRPMAVQTFTQRFSETDLGRHVTDTRVGNVRMWVGLRLLQRYPIITEVPQ